MDGWDQNFNKILIFIKIIPSATHVKFSFV
jgi:hypothetical protein